MQHTLKHLQVGESGHVTGICNSNPHYRRQLLAMGITPGTTITISRVAPLGDPIEVTLRGYRLSLRRNEADVVQVEKLS
ncbi:FeoA family protein [Spartinivicinus poritis]|uniref:FeoA family protein n=1 Tax=Spartinivicinus poritis TaxID=2994640 RepID=A0ABT5U968_9GAMM|nr:FeoA family protein [Spartinivicinus sp. A2-2]MDE1462895.1 FeoA family protein [Spartinivicinus sp. A2-2]